NRGRERAVAGKLPLLERHLAVALDAQEFHRRGAPVGSHAEACARHRTALKGSVSPSPRFSVWILTREEVLWLPAHPIWRRSDGTVRAPIRGSRTLEPGRRPRPPRTDHPSCSR